MEIFINDYFYEEPMWFFNLMLIKNKTWIFIYSLYCLNWRLNNLFLQRICGIVMIRAISVSIKAIFSSLFVIHYHSAAECHVKKFTILRKKLGFHTDGPYHLFCKHFSVRVLVFFWVIFSNKNEKELKDKNSTLWLLRQ